MLSMTLYPAWKNLYSTSILFASITYKNSNFCTFKLILITVVMSNFTKWNRIESSVSRPGMRTNELLNMFVVVRNVSQNTSKWHCNLPEFAQSHMNPLLPSSCFREEELRGKISKDTHHSKYLWQHLGEISRRGRILAQMAVTADLHSAVARALCKVPVGMRGTEIERGWSLNLAFHMKIVI